MVCWLRGHFRAIVYDMTATTTPSVSASRRGGRAWLALLASIVVTGVAAASAGAASRTSAEFYAMLDRPAWAPPAWLFGPVWSVLYVLMALAAWRVWRAAGADARGALGLYVAQLALNALWTWLFFVWRMGLWASVEVVVLWVMILLTILAFRRHDRPAALMLAPYLVWVSFATALTLSVWQRNPSLL
jgi:translocator protein